MKLSTIKAAGAASLHGTWVDVIPSLPGVRLKVCAANNPKSRAIVTEFYANAPRGKRSKEELDAVERRQILEAILVDWDGITDDEGAPIPFTREKAEEFLSDPEISFMLVEAINFAAAFVADVALKDAEDLVKN